MPLADGKPDGRGAHKGTTVGTGRERSPDLSGSPVFCALSPASQGSRYRVATPVVNLPNPLITTLIIGLPGALPVIISIVMAEGRSDERRTSRSPNLADGLPGRIPGMEHQAASTRLLPEGSAVPIGWIP